MGCAPGPRCFAIAPGGAVPSLATWLTPSLQVLQRSKGRNAVAAAAYRSCTRLSEEQLGEVYDYRRKTGHVCTELFGVAGLEMGMDDIGTLWNKAERSEPRKNSAVARELMVPLAHEWTDEQRLLCVRGSPDTGLPSWLPSIALTTARTTMSIFCSPPGRWTRK